MDELEQLLLQVSDSYYAFVRGIIGSAKDYPQRLNDIIHFIKDNPQATTSDIGKWVITNVEGIDLDNPPELELVDDDEIDDE